MQNLAATGLFFHCFYTIYYKLHRYKSTPLNWPSMMLTPDNPSTEPYQDLTGQQSVFRHIAVTHCSSNRVSWRSRRKPVFCDVKMTWPIVFVARQILLPRTAGVWKSTGGGGTSGITIEFPRSRVWSNVVCDLSPLQRHDMVSWSAQAP